MDIKGSRLGFEIEMSPFPAPRAGNGLDFVDCPFLTVVSVAGL